MIRDLNVGYRVSMIFVTLVCIIIVLISCSKDDCKNFVPSPQPKPKFSVENFKVLKQKYNYKDNIFQKNGKFLYKPLLFAHRGGVLEAPESSYKAFKFAVEEAGADVLEIDVQLTADGEFVIWHGPELKNVCIKDNPSLSKKKIYEVNWKDLNFNTCIGDPCDKNPCFTCSNNEEKSNDRRILLLSEFLELFPNAPINIEMKESFIKKVGGRNGLRDNIREFINLLDKKVNTDRTIIIASARHRILNEFRRQSNKNYSITNLSWIEIIILRFFGKTPENIVLETTYNKMFSSERMIEKMRQSGSATYVFLTRFLWIPSLEGTPIDENKFFEILDRGVDGIMTDRPQYVRTLMEKWLLKEMENIDK